MKKINAIFPSLKVVAILTALYSTAQMIESPQNKADQSLDSPEQVTWVQGKNNRPHLGLPTGPNN